MRRLVVLILAFATLGTPSVTAADGPAPSPPTDGGTDDGPQSAEPPVVSLSEFIESARHSYPGLKAAHHRVTAANARLSEARWSPYFQFTANAAFGVAPEQTGSPIFSRDSQLPVDNAWRPVVGMGIEGAIPLWTFGKLSALRDAAGAGVDAAKEGEDLSESKLILDVRRAYFGLELALDIQQMLDEGQGKLESAEARLAERLDDGDPEVNPSDTYRLATTLAEVRSRRAESEKFERAARDALTAMTGIERFEVPECPLAPVHYSLEEAPKYVSRAEQFRPELKMIKAGIKARQAQSDATNAQFLPDLALALSASYSYSPGITDQRNPFIYDRGNYQNLQAGLVAQWKLDFVGNLKRADRAGAELAETRAQAEEARTGIALEV
ncbi:MAG: TolC family protein, partial [Myxococcales bacterium]|nr:TolC family protein [Myxococcales bacterium]